MRYVLRVLALLSVSIFFVTAQNGPSSWTATPFNPPALPLAVRSPYLNSWIPQGNSPLPITNIQPRSWFQSQIIDWYASVLVDGQAYRIMGDVFSANITQANQTAVEFTPTSTTFVLTAGKMQINATFLNPIEPTDLVRQSLPFSYFYMSAVSLDGKPHNLRMYSDVTGDFIAGSQTETIQRTPEDNEDDYVILKMQLQTQQAFTEVNNFPQDGTEYYSLKKIDGTTTSWSISGFGTNREIAANASLTLDNTADTPPVIVGIGSVLSIMVDWGSITDTPELAVWALGVVRDPSIQYLLSSGTVQTRSPYFMSAFGNVSSAIEFFLDDFTRAQSAAETFDERLKAAGAALSNNYADLLALGVSQVMGTLDITLASSNDGAWNFSDVKVFMKNIGSAGSDNNGNTVQQSVNTVDVLYAAFPALLYLNPELGGYLLAPLLEYQDSDVYTQTYAAMNIGTAYPNATADGINNAHDYQVEVSETANMLIMTLAYSQASGNGTFLAKHYTLLRKWADFLVTNTLNPINQSSADFGITSGLSNNNQTNTAVKGIIGIATMAKIAEIVDVGEDQAHFNKTAASYIEQWTNDAVAADNAHVDFFYNTLNSNGLMYNLYADKLLNLDLVPDNVYQVLTSFYNNITDQANYGLPLNSIMFAASALTDTTTRDLMVGQLHGYVSANLNSTPFTAVYNPISGQAINGQGAGINSPTIGSLFSLLALNVTTKPITLNNGSTSPNSSSPTKHKSNAAAIGGGVGGGLVALIVFGVSMFFCMRRRRETLRRQRERERDTVTGKITMSAAGHGERRHDMVLEPFLLGTGVTADGHFAGAPSSYPSKSKAAQTTMHSVLPSGAGPTGPIAPPSPSGDRPSTSHQRDEMSESTVTGSSEDIDRRRRGNHSPGDRIDLQRVVMALRPLLNHDEGLRLRSEMENLRRDVERLRGERRTSDLDAPPLYSDDPA
ncbi:hypothetical protein M0805_004769 [Coniferiporia weirii]|nr:hypothetical protein M0805_004769 [Coniferiporia weirii]